MSRVSMGVLALAATLLAAPQTAAQETREFWAFESGHVRPLALSADGSRLYAVNTPDNRLEIFEVSDAGLRHLGSTPVGLEPVAVAERSAGEVWVVNHLSDDVSIVDVASSPPRVVRTLLLGDEPTDVVFASGRAFVATARRGQNTNVDPAFLTRAVNRTPGRALVFVFDPANLGGTLAGTPLTVVGDGPNSTGDSIFSDSPRALAVSNDGTRVYVAAFHSGNGSSAIPEAVVSGSQFPAPPTFPFGAEFPTTNAFGTPAPQTGAVVRLIGSQWLDDQNRNFAVVMKHTQPDLDVFEIDADAGTPFVSRSFASVGTILFNMAADPTGSRLYVSNTEANNRQRFEGPGAFCPTLTPPLNPPPLSQQQPPCSSLRGHLHESRITLIDLGSSIVTPRHLNKHLAPYTPATDTPADNERSLATPLGMAVTSNGATLYQAAFGSSKIGVFQTAQLANDSFVPSAASHIELSEGGPTGIVLDEARARLYVATRFGNSVTVVDLSTPPGTQHSVADLSFDPEPGAMRTGRRFFYDARLTSSNGEASCSSCHVFGNLDSIGWNLGNPDDPQVANPNPFVPGTVGPVIPAVFHSMKGPMTTQSLRGMANHGPMHWRGDRTGGSIGEDPLSEFEGFMAFNVAFAGLLGRSGPLAEGDMMAFTNFILEVAYPPNAFRDLSNAERSHPFSGQPTGVDLQQGRDIFMGLSDPDGAGPLPRDGADGVPVAGGGSCEFCHTLDEGAGFFGGEGTTTFEGEPQHFKVAHLRNIYAKTGFFGIACISSIPVPPPNPPGSVCNTPNLGEQVRGFGLLHDGAVGTILDFVSANAFSYQGTTAQQNQKRRALAEFVLGFPSNLRPIVGQQMTLDATNGSALDARIDLMIARSLAGDCDLVVKGRIGGEPRGWQLVAADSFESDLSSEALLSDDGLRALALLAGQELTYTCAPPGSGPRMGVDRDRDLVPDAEECGDVNADGVPAAGDADAVGRALAGLAPPNMHVPGKCNVSGAVDAADADGDGVRDDCDLLDRVLIARTAASLGGAQQVCERAL